MAVGIMEFRGALVVGVEFISGPLHMRRHEFVGPDQASRSTRPSTGMAAASSGDGVSGSSWSQTNRKSMTPVSMLAWTP
jgi:hypothetical protein